MHGYRRAFRIAGDGPPLLLIHGIGDSSRTWEQVIPLLAREHLVIAPDLLGHGASDKPRADYSVAAYANGMRDLLAVLGIDRVTLVGHSLGGGVAMQFAYQFPEKTERLVLVSSAAPARRLAGAAARHAARRARRAVRAAAAAAPGSPSTPRSTCCGGWTPGSASTRSTCAAWSRRCPTTPPARRSSARCARSSTGAGRW